ncbi:hypothetical protein [Leifsonia sp. 2MCAF36]|uniref:hypothetical protein n=1 Tax=Leifsonia sp. 2MCAF36 TaxID=3232988 RepID=UPI003F9672F9
MNTAPGHCFRDVRRRVRGDVSLDAAFAGDEGLAERVARIVCSDMGSFREVDAEVLIEGRPRHRP